MTTDDELRRARIAELQRRRSGGSSTQSPSLEAAVEPVGTPGPAARAVTSRDGMGSVSKIAVTGIGFTTMLGLVAAMGYANRSSESETPPIAPVTSPAQVVVVVHHPDGSQVPTDGSVAPSGAPVVLAAQPTVRPAPVSQAPTGRTNGSR